MDRYRHRIVLLITAAALALGVSPGMAAPPAGEAVMAWHVTLAPSWFDPSTAPAQITPFGMLYAIHDALVRSSATSGTGGPGPRTPRRGSSRWTSSIP
jgi:peptide/nickel transport system substrate-binding protein